MRNFLATIKKSSDFLFSTNVRNMLSELNVKHSQRHQNLLKKRSRLLESVRTGETKVGFREDLKSLREDLTWKANKLPEKLFRRHVEITGPGNDAKMVINAFNSGANCFMVDFEDSMTPYWNNVVDGHQNVYEAVRGTLQFQKGDKYYKINSLDKIATPHVRARGLHLFEKNMADANNNPMSATVFDIGMHIFNNGHFLKANNLGPYIYMPKLQTYEEGILVSNIIRDAQEMVGLPTDTVKVTCLIETYPMIFQTTELIYALRDNIVGLNCGRWDYIFSHAKTNLYSAQQVLPDRNLLGMDLPFLESYVKQIVKDCHQRGIHAMGGMSAFIPTGSDEEKREIMEKVTKDKIREISLGCDGAWVAHPGLVKPIQELFAKSLNNQDNQIDKENDYQVTEKDLSEIPANLVGKFTNEGIRENIAVSLKYLSTWLNGNGAVAINGLMEDLATSEISTTQLRQWIYHNPDLKQMILDILDDECEKMPEDDKLPLAKRVITEYIMNDQYQFLPDLAYEELRTDKKFKGVQYTPAIIRTLDGSKPYSEVTGVELTKLRGEYLNQYLSTPREDSYPPYYKFLGTSNGVSAVNVVSGGQGHVGPYSGGWQTNAMKNRLGDTLPDTLHVSPEEPANCAAEINKHLLKADRIQDLSGKDINKYHELALLADLEQGWLVPEKTRMATKECILNGVNVLHIEDQGPKKRCGHLGDKELDTLDGYCQTLRSANLAAQELLGPGQANQQWVRIVARTDALSAKRMIYSDKLRDPNHLDHGFIDWERGASDDGKYLYIRQGNNPETGNPWGLELAVNHATHVVKEGLASHVWMETPNADLKVAKQFMDLTNENLAPYGYQARGLYNHSPSFDWDIKFYEEAKPLANKIIEFARDNLLKRNLDLENAIMLLRLWLAKNGNQINGDYLYTPESLVKIIFDAKDQLNHGEDSGLVKGDINLNDSYLAYLFKTMKKEHENSLKTGFDRVCDTIVTERLTNFEPILSTFGYDLHLITLPEFHITGHNMHELSKHFNKEGINAFVRLAQRPERIKDLSDPTFTYYKHHLLQLNHLMYLHHLILLIY